MKYNVLMLKENQVWISNKNPDIHKIIIAVINSDLPSGKQVIYIEYWKDQDKMVKEGFCGDSHFKRLSTLHSKEADKTLFDRAVRFLKHSRAQKAVWAMKDLAGVLALSHRSMFEKLCKIVPEIELMEENLKVEDL